MITGMHHVAAVTTDVERAAKFYTEVLGLREAGRLSLPDGGTIVFVGAEGTLVELFGGGKPKTADTGEVGYPHICWLVDDVDAEYERLKGHGVHFDMAPETATPEMRIAFLRDPDGNTIELMQRLD